MNYSRTCNDFYSPIYFYSGLEIDFLRLKIRNITKIYLLMSIGNVRFSVLNQLRYLGAFVLILERPRLGINVQ